MFARVNIDVHLSRYKSIKNFYCILRPRGEYWFLTPEEANALAHPCARAGNTAGRLAAGTGVGLY
jgi:hypothetical protein